MGKSSMKIKLQKITGATVAELTVALFVLSGALAGVIIKEYYEPAERQSKEEVFFVMDSLADAQQSTYVGTDFENEADPKLAKADTLVEKERLFPKAKKKEMPEKTLDLNTASKLQLKKLPGVGEVTSLKIIKYREKHPFEKPVDIKKVKGIGPKKFEKMKKYIEVVK